MKCEGFMNGCSCKKCIYLNDKAHEENFDSWVEDRPKDQAHMLKEEE